MTEEAFILDELEQVIAALEETQRRPCSDRPSDPLSVEDPESPGASGIQTPVVRIASEFLRQYSPTSPALEEEERLPPMRRDDCQKPLTEPCTDPAPCDAHIAFEAFRAQRADAATRARQAEGSDHAALPPRTWKQLERVDLEAEFRKPVRTVREPPRWFRGSLKRAYAVALRQWSREKTPETWKLVLLVPRLLLKPTETKGEAGKAVFNERFRRFLKGDWLSLLAEAIEGEPVSQHKELDEEVAANL